jgi:hypothetical protein
MARLRYIDLVLNYIQAQVKDSSSIRISIRFRISKEKEMASFRKFALVAVALLAFAGMLSAATSVIITPSSYPGFRSEGLTEAVPDLNLAFSGLVPGVNATYDIFIYGKAGAPFTSPADEITQSFGVGAADKNSGKVTNLGSAIKIAGVVLASLEAPNCGAVSCETLTIKGIRLDANAIGVNNAVSFTIVAIPTAGVVQDASYGALTQDVTVGVVNQSMKVTTTAAGTSPASVKDTVTGASWGGMSSAVKPAEADPADAKLAGALFSVVYTPQYTGAFANALPEANIRFTFTINNLPSGLALWTAQSIKIGGAMATLISGADAMGAGGSTADAAKAWYRVNAAGATSGQVTYQLSPGGIADQTAVRIDLYSSKDTTSLGLTTTANPVTLVGSFAPLSTDVAADAYADAGMLRFATTSTTTPTFSLVTTPSSVTVSIPYVVTDGTPTGWVTGIAIGNTGGSSTVFTNTGATGACTLSFFSMDGVMTPPADLTTGSIVPGGTIAFTLNQPEYLGATAYSGQVVINCNFDHVAVYTYATGHGSTGVYAINR